MSKKSIARLYCDVDLEEDITLHIDGRQFHHIVRVLRTRVGDTVLLFNGRDGEWAATVSTVGHRDLELRCRSKTRPQENLPDVWLAFSPLTKDRTNFAVEKATEMGVSRILPVISSRTRKSRISIARLRAVSLGAAQQCGGLAIPDLMPVQTLDQLVATWPDNRRLLYCDETLVEQERPLRTWQKTTPAGLLIGPEGGFSQAERDRLHTKEFVEPISLGSRILRAETAIVAALALINIASGPVC